MPKSQPERRKETEAELFRLLVENVKDYAVFVVDPQGRVQSWNSGAERLLGYRDDEIIGQSADVFFTPEDVQDGIPQKEMRDSLEVGRGNDDRWHVRKDGSRFWSGGTMTPLRDESGNCRGFAKIMRDRTEWKLRERTVHEQAQLAAFSKDVSLALTRTDSLAEMLHHCTVAMVEHLDGAFARIWTLNSQENVLELQASAGMYTHLDGPHSQVPVGRYKIGLIAQERQPHLTNAVVDDPRVSDQEWAKEQGMVAFAGYPLIVNERVAGVMAMFARHSFTQATLEAMASVANGIALGIERKAAEEESRQQNEWLQVTLASIGDAVIATDTEGCVTFLNGVAQDLTGWTQEQAQGQPLETVFNIFNEQTRQPVENPVERVLREGVVVGLANHTILIAKDGTERPIDDSAAPIRDKAGKMIGVVLIFRDVMVQRRLERQAKEQADAAHKLAAIVDSSEDAIISKTLDGIIQSWNAAAERIFGYTVHEAVGRPITMLFPADRLDEEERIIARLRSGERVEHFDTVRLRKDGAAIPISLTISPIKDGEGRIIGASKIARDITERKQLEDERRQIAAELSDANRQKDEFLATLAHELRNPLAPIRNALQILKMPRVDATTLEQSRAMMERQVHQLIRLVDDLMDVSRVMRGKIELRREPVELANVVARAVETTQPLIEVQGHRLEIMLPNESLLLDADPMRLTQVVANLLTNAAKYTEANGHIWLSVERENDQALLSVRDNGIGIAPDMLLHVFELFVQADHATTRSQGGLGIGLTLVKNLVEMHDGSVEIRSEGLGKGSEFIMRLPLAAEHLRRNQTLTDDRTAPITPSGQRLMVVDDNRDAADTLAMMLRLQGHEVRVTHDGPSAIALANEYGPQMILLDLGMPGMDGYETARRIRQHSDLKNVVLAALTGWGQEEDRRRTAEAGFDHHLVKPVELKVLESMLSDLKKQHK